MVSLYDELADCEAFDWDGGNQDKNWGKHKVSDGEAEQVFFNEPLIAGTDPSHSRAETRYYALGRTDAGRRLFVAFTVRNKRIRIISARGMTRREQRRYEHGQKTSEKDGA
jgi:uncharacterized DUF497 family protein